MHGEKSMMLKIFSTLLVVACGLDLRSTLRMNLPYEDDLVSKDDSLLASGVTDILMEVTSAEGPLRNFKVTLMVEEEAEDIVSVNTLLKMIERPKFFLEISEESSSQNVSHDHEDTNAMMENSVIICIVKSLSWKPLWWVDEGSPAAVLLLVLSPQCQARGFLETPLLERSTSVAVFCPVIREMPWKEITFDVLTWQPFASEDQLLRLGTWNMTVFSTWNRLFVDRFQDFSRKRFRTTCSWTDEPVLFKNADGSVDGTSYRIMTTISKWLKFEFELITHKNNSWAGMEDDVDKGISDVMINVVTLTLERFHKFDVSTPFYSDGFGIVLKNPPPLPLWRNLYYPFTWQVWTGVAVSLIILAVTYHALNFGEERSFLLNSLTIVLCLISQASFQVAEKWRERWFHSLWALLAWLLNLSYTCNLIAFLTIPVFPVKLKTAKELADSNARVCMLDYGEFVPEALRTSDHPTLSALGRKLDMATMDSKLPNWGEEHCAAMVMANTHSHLDSNIYLLILYHNLGYNSKVYMLKEQLYIGNIVFLFKKHTPWKEKFNTGLRRLIEAGLVAKYYSDILSKYTQKEVDGSSELSSLTVAHMQGAFLILLIGLGLATLFFTKEVLSHASVSFSTSGSKKQSMKKKCNQICFRLKELLKSML